MIRHLFLTGLAVVLFAIGLVCLFNPFRSKKQ